MARKTYDQQTKAAVIAALLEGQSVSQVAQQWHLSRSTVTAWRDSAGLDSVSIRHQKTASLGVLVGNYLRTNLETLTAQLEPFRDRSWIEKQPASDLAVLHGVLADKAFRILSALAAAPEDEAHGPLDFP